MTRAIIVKRQGSPVILAAGSAVLSSMTAQAKRSRDDAQSAAAASEASAAYAESMSGPTYANTSAGLAATTDGQAFAVDNGDGTVTVYLNDGGSAVEQRTLATTAFLASPLGKVAIGLTDEQTVGGRLDETLSLGDSGASAAASDSATIVAAAFDAQKQPWSITYTDGGAVVMTPEHSVDIPAQYTIKSAIPIWSKTAARAKQDLNSGMTLAADATDDAIFLIGGSTNQPEWVNQVTIEGGAYSSLKDGGALVRVDPGVPVPAVLGDSFITNVTMKDITYAGPEGIRLDGYYSQSCVFENIRFVGRADTLFHISGHHIVFRNIDKTGWTGDSADPLIRIGDPSNISPTTNVLLENVILDLNGDAGKDSVHIVNAKRVTLDSLHHEMTFYDQALRIESSFGTVLRRPAFATSRTDAVITLDDSDLFIDLWEDWSDKDWRAHFSLAGASRLTIDTLRIYNAGVVPLNEGTIVRQVDHVQAGDLIDSVKLVAAEPIINIVADPTFQNPVSGYSVSGAGTPTLSAQSGNKVDPDGRILRITYSADASGVSYITIPLPVMTGRKITCGMIAEIDPSGGVDASTTFMCVADGSSNVNHGRLYASVGFAVSVSATQTGPSAIAIAIFNPRQNTNYDVHMLAACPGEQLAFPKPVKKAALVADAAGSSPTKAEFDALLTALKNSGLMKTA